jgi:hypothetical protein
MPHFDRVIAWLEIANARILRNPWWFLVAFLLLYGVASTDYDDFQQLAAHPLTLHPDAARQFLHSSPLLYFLGCPLLHCLGPLVSFAVLSAAGFAVMAWGFRRLTAALPSDAVPAVVLVWLSTPLMLVLSTWLGKTDPAVVGMYLLLVAARSPLARSCLALAMVLCHREIATIVLVGHVVIHRRDLVPVAIGSVLGALAVLGYHHLVLPAPPMSRSDFAQIHGARILAGFVANPVAHLVFSLGWFWMLFVIELRRRPRLAYVALVVVVLAAASLTYDYTRVATMCSLPVIVQVALGLASRPAGLPPFLRRMPFPLLFLLQFQILDAHRLCDSRWFLAAIQVP